MEDVKFDKPFTFIHKPAFRDVIITATQDVVSVFSLRKEAFI